LTNTGDALREVCLYIYSPVEETSSLGLNRLDVGLRLILEVGGGNFWKEGAWTHCARPVSTGGRSIGPLQNLLELRFALVPSSVFLSLMMYVSSRTSFVIFMKFNPPSSLFWNNPAENIKSLKLVEIVS
jgi:hypothetical protein